MSDGGQKKRKSKGWYKKQAYHNKRVKGDEKYEKSGHRLVPGLKGFIITCNDHERDAVKESYNILNEYADVLYGPEAKEDAAGSEDSGDDDIEKAIAKEVESLKEAATTGQRRFQNSQSGAKNCIFIKTSLDDPAGLAHAIFKDMLETKVQKSRYALRLLPVVGTCKANQKEISDLAKEVLKPFFTDTKFEVTYSIIFKARNNNGLGREITISTLKNTINETFSSVLLRYTPANPLITVLVEVMCGVACIAVARDFVRFRKYNLVEVVNERQAVAATDAKTEAKDKVGEEVGAEAEKTKEAMSGDEHITSPQKTESETAGGMEKSSSCIMTAVTSDVYTESASASKEMEACISEKDTSVSSVPQPSPLLDGSSSPLLDGSSSHQADSTQSTVKKTDTPPQDEVSESVSKTESV